MAIIKQYVQGDIIKAEDHNLTQRNGVIFSKPVYSVVSQQSVYSLNDFVMEQSIFEGLKLKLLIDTDSLTDNSFISIKNTNYPVNEAFKSGNVYNLVCVKSTNDLNEDVYSFIVEKSGGGASFATLVDEDIDITPTQGMISSGITVPNADYNLINVVLSYQDNYQNQDVVVKAGVVTSKDLIIRSSLVDADTARSDAISCQPQELYSEFQISVFIKDSILYFFSPSGFKTITHVKIDVM